MTLDSPDDSQAQRSYKNSIFLQSFEDYLSEIATSNHGMKHEEMIKLVQDNFQRSMLANFQFHSDLVKSNENFDDRAMATYHTAMARIYKSFLR